MRRLELSDDEHAKLLDVISRQYRATRDPELRELALHVGACPRVIAYIVSVPIPAVEQKSGGEAEAPPPPDRHVTVGTPEGAEGPPLLGAAASR